MTNKEQLQTNNASLDGYIARINAAKEIAVGLPAAGGDGANVEVWTGMVYGNTGLGDIPDIIVYYIDETFSQRKIKVLRNEAVIITVIAHTLIVVTDTINDYSELQSMGTNIEGVAYCICNVVLPTADGFTIN